MASESSFVVREEVAPYRAALMNRWRMSTVAFANGRPLKFAEENALYLEEMKAHDMMVCELQRNRAPLALSADDVTTMHAMIVYFRDNGMSAGEALARRLLLALPHEQDAAEVASGE